MSAPMSATASKTISWRNVPAFAGDARNPVEKWRANTAFTLCEEVKILQEELNKEQEKIRDNATIYDILKLEHRDVKKLFKQIVDNDRYQDNVYMQIKTALALHIAGEEKLFYSRLENNPETRVLALEAYEEHDIGRKVINDIDNSTTDDAKFARVKVLSEAIDQHIDEEEGDLFKKAKKVLSDEDEREIARQFMNEKMQNMPKTSTMSSSMPSTGTPTM